MKVKALERIDKNLQWIDQTQLPNNVQYRKTDNYKNIIAAIKRLEIRGAPAIGIAAAYGMAVAVEKTDNSSLNFITKVGEEFKSARPTAVNLFWAVDRMVKKVSDNEKNKLSEIKKILWEEAENIHREDKKMCQNIGKNGAELINDRDVILTHCNAGALATGGIGTALGVIYTCRDEGKKISVYADETRPLLQGARLTAWELMNEGVDVTLICDNTAGMLMKQGKIDHIIVGADRIAKNGDFANKIGTYSLAVLAKENKVPFYVAVPSSTFDDSIESGDKIIIEERAPQEVTEGFGKRTAPENVKVYSPAFDITPYELVSYYITDKEVRKGGRK